MNFYSPWREDHIECQRWNLFGPYASQMPYPLYSSETWSWGEGQTWPEVHLLMDRTTCALSQGRLGGAPWAVKLLNPPQDADSRQGLWTTWWGLHEAWSTFQHSTPQGRQPSAQTRASEDQSREFKSLRVKEMASLDAFKHKNDPCHARSLCLLLQGVIGYKRVVLKYTQDGAGKIAQR